MMRIKTKKNRKNSVSFRFLQNRASSKIQKLPRCGWIEENVSIILFALDCIELDGFYICRCIHFIPQSCFPSNNFLFLPFCCFWLNDFSSQQTIFFPCFFSIFRKIAWQELDDNFIGYWNAFVVTSKFLESKTNWEKIQKATQKSVINDYSLRHDIHL